jgi:hypothetical protein
VFSNNFLCCAEKNSTGGSDCQGGHGAGAAALLCCHRHAISITVETVEGSGYKGLIERDRVARLRLAEQGRGLCPNDPERKSTVENNCFEQPEAGRPGTNLDRQTLLMIGQKVARQ